MSLGFCCWVSVLYGFSFLFFKGAFAFSWRVCIVVSSTKGSFGRLVECWVINYLSDFLGVFLRLSTLFSITVSERPALSRLSCKSDLRLRILEVFQVRVSLIYFILYFRRSSALSSAHDSFDGLVWRWVSSFFNFSSFISYLLQPSTFF